MKKIQNNNLPKIDNCFDTGTKGHISNKFANNQWMSALLSTSLMTNLALFKENTIYE
jgi:hypothetical protein